MTTVTLWILLAVSNGSHNYGTLTVIDRFATAADCGNVIAEIKTQPKSEAAYSVQYRCVPAKVVR